MIWSIPDDFPVATVTRGKWGDTYPAIRAEEGIGGKAEAYTEMIEYGSVSDELTEANERLLTEAVNALPALLDAVEHWLQYIQRPIFPTGRRMKPEDLGPAG